MERVEIITGRERRRRWSEAEQRRLVAEAFAPGAIVAHVARRHEVAESCLYAWRKRFAGAGLPAGRWLPVLVNDGSPPTAHAAPRPARQAVVMLPDGTRVEIEAGYPVARLKALIAALRKAR